MTIAEQVALLRSRGLRIDSRTAWILEREGYYSIVNGYKRPFLDAESTKLAHDDRFISGTSFDGMYALYVFDRNLRFALFRMTTLAEAVLKTVCSHEFTRLHQDEKNPYLNPDNYATDGEGARKAGKLIPRLQKILDLNNDDAYSGGKDYLRHYFIDHEGEVPLWVLANDLTLGQMYWFYQSQDRLLRGAIARSFTDLYADSHRKPVDITSRRLDTVYRRIKDYRNICAHDERLYCAHPHDLNATVFQLIRDLRFVIDKKRYLEFLQRFDSLLAGLHDAIPAQMDDVCGQIGLRYPEDLHQHMQAIRES